MKKFLLLLLLSFMLIGCKPEPPTNYNVNENSDWEIWATGKLTKIEIVKHSKCRHKKPYPGPSCWSYYQYTFEDGTKVDLTKIKDKGLVKVDSTGVLYKLGANNYDRTAMFQWITGPKSQASIPAKKTKDGNFNVLIDYSEAPVWIDCTQKSPNRYTPVLIKFENETLSVGYINNLNEWKLSINRRQDDGGGATIPKNEIIFWKSLDLN